MAYHEIRCRPVVRYILTDYAVVGNSRRSITVGEYDSANVANRVGAALARVARMDEREGVKFEPVRPLRIDIVSGPGQPIPATRYELREAAEAA